MARYGIQLLIVSRLPLLLQGHLTEAVELGGGLALVLTAYEVDGFFDF